jgi:hypothetical protein
MNLKETDAKYNCAREDQQQFNRPSGNLETVFRGLQ